MEVLHPHCAGLDVHNDTVVACVRHTVEGKVEREVRSFKTTTVDLKTLSEWLSAEGCTHLFLWLYRRCPGMRDALVIVRPDTIIRWHRMGFLAWWRWKSGSRGGRPRVDRELRVSFRYRSRPE